MTDNEIIIVFFNLAMFVYLIFYITTQNKRLEKLEERYKPQAKKQTIARMLAAGMIKPNQARQLLFNPTCTCEDLTTPAYPEFAAVMFDPNCPFHGDLEDKSLD